MIVPLNRLFVLAADVTGQPAAGGAGEAPTNGMRTLWSLMPFVLIIGAFFWLMSRSQKKREQKRQQVLDSIRPKDDVVTIGGIHGRVLQVKEEQVVLRIDADKDIKITVAKSGIGRKVGEEQVE